MIEAEKLGKRFGVFEAVRDVSFAVEPGEVLGFLGPNGAGKSTTMRMLAGFLLPDSGVARICGHDVRRQRRAAQSCLGYLAENTPAYQEMSVLQFLDFIAQARGLERSKRYRRLQEISELLAINEVLLQPIETLSRGFRRRVGLAQALLHDPRALILDEPTDGLDPNQKHQVRALIRGLAEQRSIIISTHILEEVGELCSRVIVIAAGRIVANATPAELLRRSRYHRAVVLELREALADQSALEALPGVDALDIGQQGRRITVFPRSGENIFPRVYALAQERRWPVESLHAEEGRLDEVFRELTQGKGGEKGAADPGANPEQLYAIEQEQTSLAAPSAAQQEVLSVTQEEAP